MSAPAPPFTLPVDVIASLDCATATNVHTIEDLRVLLSHEFAQSKKAPRSVLSKPGSRVTVKEKTIAKGPGRGNKLGSSKKQTFDIYEAVDPPLQPLEASKRRKAATDIFNTTLKCLTRSAKAKIDKKSDATQCKPVTPTKTSKSTLLQQCSPNRQRRDRLSTCDQAHEFDTVGMTADCAIIALDCLHNLGPVAEQKLSDHREMLGKGALILAEKLITLREAEKALRVTSKICEQYQKGKSASQIEAAQNFATCNQARTLQLSMVDQLDSLSKANLAFVSSYQSQVLRLAILLGSEAVIPSFIEDLNSKSTGSPCSIILASLQHGILDIAKAGEQLRTIAQALLKLYSVSITDKLTRNKKAELNFSLLVEALMTKVKSWKMLKYKAELDRDFWAHFLKALRRFEADQEILDHEAVTFITKSVRLTISYLRENGFAVAIPYSVTHAIADIAEKAACYKDGLDVLQDCSNAKPQLAPELAMLLHWRIAVFTSKQYRNDVQQLAPALEQATASISKNQKLTSEHIDEALLLGARLRKLAVAIFHQAATTTCNTNPEAKEGFVFKCCMSILCRFSRLIGEFLLSTSANVVSEQWKRAFTSFAKTFEAILEVDKLSSHTFALLGNEYDGGVQQCVNDSKTLINTTMTVSQNDDVVAFVGNLLVRTSQFYWKRYVEQPNQNMKGRGNEQLLELACTALAQLTVKIQHSAMYGTKLEKLALFYLSAQNTPDACRCLTDAVEHYIELGSLAEAAEAALTGPDSSVWSRRGTKAYMLGKSLSSLAKLRLTYNIQGTLAIGWLYGKEDASDIQQCLLFEAQIAAANEHEFTQDQATQFSKYARSMIERCCRPDLAIYKLRFLSHVLRLASRNLSLSDSICSEMNVVASYECTMPNTDAGIPLSNYSASLHHLVSVQWYMQHGKNDIQSLQIHLESLLSIVRGLDSMAALDSTIDNLPTLIGQLQAAIAFARLIDCTDVLLPCLLSTKHLLKLATPNDLVRIAEITTQIAYLYNRQEQTLSAGKAFAVAEQLFSTIPGQNHARGKWMLCYAQYLINISSTSKALEMCSQVAACYEPGMPEKALKGRDRLDRDSSISRAALTAAQIAARLGDLDSAVRFAKQAVKVSSQIWQAVESPSQFTAAISTEIGNSSMDGLTAELSTLTVTSEAKWQDNKIRGSAYWDYVDLHCSALELATAMSMRLGLCQDAEHYSKQLCKVTKAIGSSTRTVRADASRALLTAKAGYVDEAIECLQNLGQTRTPGTCFEDRESLLCQAEALIEVRQLADAQRILDALDVFHVSSRLTDDSVQSPKKGVTKPPLRGRVKAAGPLKGPARRPGKPPLTAASKTIAPLYEKQTTRSQQYLLERICTLQNNINLLLPIESGQVLQPIDNSSSLLQSSDVAVTSAMIVLHQALSELSSDAVKCVLAETAVALPVRYRSNRKSGRISFVHGTGALVAVKSAKNPRGKTIPAKKTPIKPQLSAGEDMIVSAQKLLHGFQDKQATASAETVHIAHKMGCKLGLLTSTMASPITMSSTELVLQSLMPKDIVQCREKSTIQAERATQDKTQLLTWPDVASLGSFDMSDASLHCNMDDLADIPGTWSIIMVSLSEDHQELLMSKIVGNRSPFLLRIPLTRSDMDIDSEAGFSYADAKAELQDIVTCANVSAHDQRGQGDRETRKMWYAEREELDERLQNWLCNIESIWLGGFRGLMAPHTYDDDLLAKFGQKVDYILDKHLPSRQKPNTTVKGRVALHAHVLELLLGLGHPDEQDLDDAITDLLYFVVDILQFSGEHNAYDEIDFDRILVDVFDAMREFHRPILQEQATSQHTILIVDKEMAAFPWESLPCLSNQSVSRMPSLGSIVDRIRMIRQQPESEDAFSISTGKGAYILNPSSDLTSTQSTFQPILQRQLTTFTSMINKAPTELEFTSLLTEKELLLYFGHGSGAQYIRGRTIRNLDTCAVTLLMGCSSAKMNECGKFESYGMPGYYIGGMSNCMAVVGTLWDVTDRDIDRFALKTMVEWGLVDEDDVVAKVLEKVHKKSDKTGQEFTGKHASRADRRGIVTLDDAVRRGRDACLLRYLNGAAPVVYGIPVLLN